MGAGIARNLVRTCLFSQELVELLHRLPVASFVSKLIQQNAREESVRCRVSQDGDEVELKGKILQGTRGYRLATLWCVQEAMRPREVIGLGT